MQEALARLPDGLRSAKVVHVQAGTYTSDLKVILQTWISGNKGSVISVAPTKRGEPLPADLAVMVPRPEDAPVTLAYYLGSQIPFAVLVPNDLLSATFSDRVYPGADPTVLKTLFQAASKLQMLITQMTWVIGNVPAYKAIEMFTQLFRTAAPITGTPAPVSTLNDEQTFDEPVPTTVEEWI